MYSKLRAVLDERKGEYLNCLLELLSCDTQVIGHGVLGGREKAGQDCIEDLLRRMGAAIAREPLEERLIQKGIAEYREGNPGHNYDDRYNIVANFKGCEGGRSLMFNGHIDVMPPGDLSSWRSDPFKPEIRDGMVYARGAADMKTGLMASVLGVKLLQDADIEIPGDVTLLSVADEEGGGNGTLVSMLNGHRADAAVVCEPTNRSIIVSHMGFIFFEVNVTGVALHMMSKWKGVNAIEKAIFLIDALRELENKWLMIYRHPVLPPPTLNVGVISGGTAGCDVPDSCTFKFCLHYVPGLVTHDEVIQEVKDTLLLRSQGDKWLRDNPPAIRVYQEGRGFEMDSEHCFVRTAQECLLKITGDEMVVTGSPAANDARLMRNIGQMPTIVMGPGRIEDCHVVNELISVDEFFAFVLIYAALIYDWCGGRDTE